MRELIKFLKIRKKLFLLPLIAILIFFGVIIAFASNSIIAPFVYTFF